MQTTDQQLHTATHCNKLQHTRNTCERRRRQMTSFLICITRFMCVTWLIHMCDMTHSYVRHDAFICVTWLIHMCATESCICYELNNPWSTSHNKFQRITRISRTRSVKMIGRTCNAVIRMLQTQHWVFSISRTQPVIPISQCQCVKIIGRTCYTVVWMIQSFKWYKHNNE